MTMNELYNDRDAISALADWHAGRALVYRGVDTELVQYHVDQSNLLARVHGHLSDYASKLAEA